MISAIVIGRNEGWKLTLCIKSMISSLAKHGIEDYELIYVDSDSDDDSLDRALAFPNIKVFKISGQINAAVARNVAFENSKGTILVFADGDMEVLPVLLEQTLKPDESLFHPFMSSNWMNFHYDQEGKFLRKKPFKIMKEDSVEKVTGGLFLIDRQSWVEVGGMDNRYRKSQDLDLGLKLARKGIFLQRKKEIGANHHTIDYLDEKRMWSDFKNLNHLYGRSALYRKHLLNKHIYPRILRNDYGFVLLVLILISAFVSWSLALVLTVLYFVLTVHRAKYKLMNLVYFILRDISVLGGLFVFFPKKVEYRVERIQ